MACRTRPDQLPGRRLWDGPASRAVYLGVESSAWVVRSCSATLLRRSVSCSTRKRARVVVSSASRRASERELLGAWSAPRRGPGL
ncbi:hypothetical protein HBB16_14645 [Pseudonocardia sp. MCCB 268]|nr:hypothetical protein [Pseudonocardia cytotoxica]